MRNWDAKKLQKSIVFILTVINGPRLLREKAGRAKIPSKNVENPNANDICPICCNKNRKKDMFYDNFLSIDLFLLS